MVTKKLSAAEKAQRAATASAAAAARKAAKSGDPDAMKKAAAGLVGLGAEEPEPSKKFEGKTVAVACKHSPGIFIQVHAKKNEVITNRDGSKTAVERWRPSGPMIKIKGPGHPMKPEPGALLPGGFAITEGVPEAAWEHWLAHNSDSSLVLNGLIFAHEKVERVLSIAKERGSIRTGAEPLNVALVRANGQQVIADKRVRVLAPNVSDGKLDDPFVAAG